MGEGVIKQSVTWIFFPFGNFDDFAFGKDIAMFSSKPIIREKNSHFWKYKFFKEREGTKKVPKKSVTYYFNIPKQLHYYVIKVISSNIY